MAVYSDDAIDDLVAAARHLLRHTALTRLANLGASVYVVQAVARHAHLQTTQGYLHTHQVGLERVAATLLDRAARRSCGTVLATPGNRPPERH